MAAVAASKDEDISRITTSDGCLVQTVIDQFDADIYSKNSKLSTDTLVMILTQPNCGAESKDVETIPRLTRAEMALPVRQQNTMHL